MKRSLLPLIACLLCSYGSLAQTLKPAKLKPLSKDLNLEHVYISAVTDDRSDTGAAADIRLGHEPAAVRLEGGTTSAMHNFLNQYVQQQTDKDSFELHLQKLQVVKSMEGLHQKIDLQAGYAFFRNGKKIIDYSSAYYIKAATGAAAYIGQMTSQSLESVLKEFDQWWASNSVKYTPSDLLPLDVIITVSDHSNDTDQVAYRPDRPLHIEDFKGKPDKLSVALAATYSGFALQYELSGDYDSRKATVTLLPYFDRTKSWMKPAGKNAYVLQHEQLHFDIAALKTYALAAALRSSKCNSNNFRETVERLQKQYSKEAEELQAAYDEATAHGTLKGPQRQWEARIRAELSDIGAAAGG